MLGKGTFYTFDRRKAVPANHGQTGNMEAEVRIHPETGERYCLSAIVEATRDKDWNVRSQAVITLGRLQDLQGLPALVHALADKNRQVRSRAITALEQMDTPESPLLIQVLLADTLSTDNKASILTAVMKLYRPGYLSSVSTSAELYCHSLLDHQPQEQVDLNPEEREAMARLREAAAEVLEALKLQREAGILLRASSPDHSNDHKELLRSTFSPAGTEPDELLRPTEQKSSDGD
jgi:HEAT repeat protein